jgi:hypothetical protein
MKIEKNKVNILGFMQKKIRNPHIGNYATPSKNYLRSQHFGG